MAEKAKEKFKLYPHIHILQGDSGERLTEIMGEVRAPILYWLDAHYSGEFYVGCWFVRTAMGKSETPVLEELKVIMKNGIGDNVILIDDARFFNGKGDYPDVQKLKELVQGISPGIKVDVKCRKD